MTTDPTNLSSPAASAGPGTDLPTDRGFLARLLLGALAEHEQRRLVTRLLAFDEVLRQRVATSLRRFVGTPDAAIDEVVELCERAAARDDAQALATARARLLRDAAARDDLDEIVRAYTYDEALRLGEGARRMFSWPMAEHLLARACSETTGDREARTALYLAIAVVDVLELLGVSGLIEPRPAYATALRRAIDAADPTPG